MEAGICAFSYLIDVRDKFLVSYGAHMVAEGTSRCFLSGSKRDLLLEYENIRKIEAATVKGKSVS